MDEDLFCLETELYGKNFSIDMDIKLFTCVSRVLKSLQYNVEGRAMYYLNNIKYLFYIT